MSALERRVQRAMLASAAQFRDVERIGPFTATFACGSDHPAFNYAIPAEGAEPDPAWRRSSPPTAGAGCGRGSSTCAHSRRRSRRHVYLTAAGEAEARIYARVGFERIGESLYVSAPA